MKTVEIIVKKSLKRPPLKTSFKYFKVFLPNNFVIIENKQKQINLKFSNKSARQHYTSDYFNYSTPETTSRFAVSF